MMRTVLLTIALLLLSSCTENVRTRAYGGHQEMKLKPGIKLVNATWKNADLWVLMRKMRPGEEAETHVFAESSSFGVWEGSITFVERR
jgi:hypothetical protein